MKKIIVSHKRATRVTTPLYVANTAICVPKSQEYEYTENNPGVEIIAHPDSVIGLSPKRQWILDNFKDVFQLDDDIIGVHRVYAPPKYHKRKLEPQEVSDWIDDTAEWCKEMDIKLFGFNRTANTIAFSGAQPFQFNKYITGGAFGIVGEHKLHFPDYPHFVGEDYWITLLNAYHHRRNFIDARISFFFAETEANTGGVADYRTEEKRKETYLYLKKHFGDSVVPKKTTCIKKKIMKWEKTIKIDF